MAPTSYDGVYQALQHQDGPLIATTIGVLALVPAAIGALTLVLPIALVLATRRVGWRPLDGFPIWCVVIWLAVVVFAPATGQGDNTDFQQRPFVVVYATALVWTLLLLDRWIGGVLPARSALRFALPATIVAGLATATVVRWNDDPARPRFAWGTRHFDTRVDRGLIDAAAFVRTNALPGDTFALIPTDPAAYYDDDATRLAALAGVPAYLGRAAIQSLNGEARRQVVAQRLAELTQVETTTDPEAAFVTLRKTGVDFVVALGDHGPHFDPAGTCAAFRTRGALVYRIGPQ